MIIGLLMGGLILSSKLGTVGSKAMFGAAEGLMKGVGTWGKKLGPRAGAGLLRKTGAGTALSNLGARFGPASRAGKILTKAGTTINTYKAPSLASSVWSGMKKGSGLFKGKSAQQWACNICNRVIPSTSKPTSFCSQYRKLIIVSPNTLGATPPTTANGPWTMRHGQNDWNPVATP